MASSVNKMSLFEQFSYKKKRVQSVKDSYENEREPCSESSEVCDTPNREHSFSSVSLTPAESFRQTLNSKTPLSCKNIFEKKKRAFLSSSSDESSEQIRGRLPKALFRDIPCPKRSKNSRIRNQNLANTTKGQCAGKDEARKPWKILLADARDTPTSNTDPIRQRCRLVEDSFSDEDQPRPEVKKERQLRKKRNKRGTFLFSDTEGESEEESGRQNMESKKSSLHVTPSGRPGKRTRVSSGGKENFELGGPTLLKESSGVVVDGRQDLNYEKEPSSDACSSLGQSSSKWLSARRGRPFVRQKLLKFVYEKKQRNGTSTAAYPVASVKEGNSCFVADSSHQKLMSPVISGETSTAEVTWPLIALHSSTESESDVELDLDSSEPIAHSSHRKRKGQVVVECESSDNVMSSGRCSPSASEEEASDGTGELESSNGSDNTIYSEKEKEEVLCFLDISSVEELSEIPGFSGVKAKLLDDLRPFQNWKELATSLDSAASKGLVLGKVVDGCLKLLKEREMVAKLLSECQAISSSIHHYLSNLSLAAGSECDIAEVLQCHRQPKLLSERSELKPYQMVGLNWLALLHVRDLNGILADEMGLGKTVQAIAFLAYLLEKGCNGVFLIVVPSSTIENWSRELGKWCPSLKVMLYYGSAEERLVSRSRILSGEKYHVVLSTYKLCISQRQDRKFFQKLSVECLVLDEGHMVKNMASQRYSHLVKIRARRRLLLTGTPLQNNLLELISLLSFVMPDIFQNFCEPLKKTFAKKMNERSSYYQDQVAKAKEIMQPFILRRLKNEVLQQLPAKVQETVFCQLSGLQLQLYKQAVATSHRPVGPSLLESLSKEGETGMDKSMSAVTLLRKIAMHPLLTRHHYDDGTLRKMAAGILTDPAHLDADEDLVFEDMQVMSDFELHRLCRDTKVLNKYCLSSDLLDDSAKLLYLNRKLKELKAHGSRVLLFSQFTMMLDILEEFLRQHDHTYSRLDGTTPITERQPLIDKYNSDASIFIFLLSTKAGGLGLNLTSANVVVLHDIDFNPYNDKQAEDRCHRVGQTREVSVFRVICKDTVEEEVLRCAEKKLQLEQDICQLQTQSSSSAQVAFMLASCLSVRDDH